MKFKSFANQYYFSHDNLVSDFPSYFRLRASDIWATIQNGKLRHMLKRYLYYNDHMYIECG